MSELKKVNMDLPLSTIKTMKKVCIDLDFKENKKFVNEAILAKCDMEIVKHGLNLPLSTDK